jgi:hypothetical protein
MKWLEDTLPVGHCLFIPVEELTRSSLGVHLLAEDLSLEVSEALGISLLEVWAQYFSKEGSIANHIMLEESEERD